MNSHLDWTRSLNNVLPIVIKLPGVTDIAIFDPVNIVTWVIIQLWLVHTHIQATTLICWQYKTFQDSHLYMQMLLSIQNSDCEHRNHGHLYYWLMSFHSWHCIYVGHLLIFLFFYEENVWMQRWKTAVIIYCQVN